MVGADVLKAKLGANDTDNFLLDNLTYKNLLASIRNWLGKECMKRKLNSTGVWMYSNGPIALLLS